jgi:HSP20 family protein
VPETGKKNLTVPDWAPAVNVAETPREYLIKVELPEVGKGDIKVSVEDGVRCIDGERPARDKKYHRVERAYSCCFRSFALPDNFDEQRLSAVLKEGVLGVHLPKSQNAKPRGIEVKAA